MEFYWFDGFTFSFAVVLDWWRLVVVICSVPVDCVLLDLFVCVFVCFVTLILLMSWVVSC